MFTSQPRSLPTRSTYCWSWVLHGVAGVCFLQQGLIESSEVEDLAAVFFGTHSAAFEHELGLGGIAQFLDLGDQHVSGNYLIFA